MRTQEKSHIVFSTPELQEILADGLVLPGGSQSTVKRVTRQASLLHSGKFPLMSGTQTFLQYIWEARSVWRRLLIAGNWSHVGKVAKVDESGMRASFTSLGNTPLALCLYVPSLSILLTYPFFHEVVVDILVSLFIDSLRPLPFHSFFIFRK